ncbi:YafY family transcriptional regulator [Shimazuella sp. AN120528]|uniref:helix-turn-helix transcriptional regulator n=1 Tax=Shimazuella soli TaxID=1892854 RepID=UPI001F1103A0|nr:YafY family protein [Shimazuella soli]MCH5584800.1 YafY family transcriptional regulator [Shimazuella soli]
MLKSQRLIQLIMLINAKKSFTVPELAAEFGLSTRTITRDLQELSQLGVPIYSVQGRGGGYRLLQERLLPPITFSESEAISIYFACHSLQYFGSLPFDDGAATSLQKFYHYLPSDVKEQIDRLRDKVVIWNPYRSMSTKCLKALLQSIMIKSCVTIEYNSSNGISSRDIQPIGLYASKGYWYCPAYCFSRKDYRLFRADRIHSVKLNPSVVFMKEVDQRSVEEWNAPELRKKEKTTLVIQLTLIGLRTLKNDGWFGDSLEFREDGTGLARLSIPIDNLPFFVDLVWRLGEEAKILEPEKAVDLIQQKIRKITGVYGKSDNTD